LGLVVAMTACGDDAPTGPVARFALPSSGLPAAGAVPWPSDIYRDASGGVADTISDWSLFGIEEAEPSAMLAGIGAFDGFGLQSGVLFGVDLGADDVIDPATLAGAFALVDVEAGTVVPSTAGYDHVARAIVVIPDAPLGEGKRYAAAITSDIQLASGVALGATSQFRELRSGSPSGDRASFREALDAAGSVGGLDRDGIIAATLYTTTTETARLKATRDRLVAGMYGAAPTLLTASVAAPYRFTRFGRTAHAGWTATLDEWLGDARKDANNQDLTGVPGPPEPATTGFAHDSIAAVINATFVSPMFPRPFAKTADVEDGTIGRDGSGNAVPADRNAQVPVMIVVPAGTEPVGGWPVVIFHHGAGGDRFVAFAVANELARAGIATIAIDGHLHGMRIANAIDNVSNGKGTYTGPDGITETTNPLAPVELAGGVRNMVRLRDNYWQLALDLVQLRRLVDNLDLAALADEFGGATPRIDATRVGFWGYSMGSQAGTFLAAIEPETSIDPFVLAVPPGRLTMVLADSPYFTSQLNVLAALGNIRFDAFDAHRYAVAFQLVQQFADTADTPVFAPRAAREHNLWFVTGHADESVPPTSSDVLARAFGATQLTPALRPVDGLPQGGPVLTAGASGRVTGFFEVAPGTHGHAFHRFYDATYEPPFPRATGDRFVPLSNKVTIRQPVVGEQRATIAFMKSVWAGAPTIDVGDARFLGLAPAKDFDDDGHCDDAERTAGTNPYDPSSRPAGAAGCVRDLGFTSP